MRLVTLKNIPRIVFYLGLVGLLLALVVLSGNSTIKDSNQGGTPTQIQGSPGQESGQPAVESSDKAGVEVENSQQTVSNSSRTKIKVSVNSTTANGETTGLTKVVITTSKGTQDFSEALDECLTAGKIRVSTQDSNIKCESEDGSVEINWKTDNDERQKSNSSFNLKVDEKNKSSN